MSKRKSLSTFFAFLTSAVVCFTSCVWAESPSSDLHQLVAQLQKRPDDIPLRKKIIQLVKKMPSKPEIPEGVVAAMGKAKHIMDADNSEQAFGRAADAYEIASLLAPWEGDVYFNLAYMQEKGARPKDALISYNLFLLAKPNAKERKAVIEKIGALEDEAHITFKELESPGRGTMVLIPAEKFWMGSPDNVGGSDEHPRHQVYLDDYYIDKYLVTYNDWNRAVDQGFKYSKMEPKDGDRSVPVVNVRWVDAKAYATFVGKRLPTEAEWEKACRGGTTTKWFFGNDNSVEKEYFWTDRETTGFRSWAILHPVGQKRPNPFGLYDMGGNVIEWCSDWYESGYFKDSPQENPQGPFTGKERVLRGGVGTESDGRSACRYWKKSPTSFEGFIGFRCVMDPPGKEGNSSVGGETVAQGASKEKAPYELSNSDIAFGTKQLEKMLQDRPVMAKYVKKGDPVWNWAIRQFAGEYIKGGVEWDGSDLEKNAWNQMTIPGPDLGKRAFMKLARNHPVGDPHAGAVVTAPVLWHEAVVTFCSLMDRDKKAEIDDAVYAGKIGRDDYVFEFLALTYIYEKNERKAFWTQIWKPNCQKLGLPADDGGFGVAINPQIDQAPTRAEFLKGFSAKKIGDYDFYVQTYEKNVRPYLKSQNIQVPPPDGSPKARNLYMNKIAKKIN